MNKGAVLALLLAVGVLCTPAASIEPDYRRMEVAGGLSIDIPSHWYVIDADSRRNLVLSGNTAAELAGVQTQMNKVRVLAVNALPSPTGAMIGLSISWPPEYSEADLRAASPADLEDLVREFEISMRAAEPHSGVRVLEVQPAHIESFKQHTVVVLRYRRASSQGPSPWQVTQYKIPLDDRIVELTLSYRESDQWIWRPILERVKKSLTF